MKELPILNREKLRSLYERIGGEAALQKILESFYEKMSNDVLIGFFFTGKDLAEISSQQRKFLMRSWGVSDSYEGKPPSTAHANLAPILEGHFDRRLVLLEETLAEFGLSELDKQIWVSFEAAFRQQVVARR